MTRSSEERRNFCRPRRRTAHRLATSGLASAGSTWTWTLCRFDVQLHIRHPQKGRKGQDLLVEIGVERGKSLRGKEAFSPFDSPPKNPDGPLVLATSARSTGMRLDAASDADSMVLFRMTGAIRPPRRIPPEAPLRTFPYRETDTSEGLREKNFARTQKTSMPTDGSKGR